MTSIVWTFTAACWQGVTGSPRDAAATHLTCDRCREAYFESCLQGEGESRYEYVEEKVAMINLMNLSFLKIDKIVG